MKKSNPEDEYARETVKKFCNYIVRLKAVHHSGKMLFEDRQAQLLMEKIAKRFFLDMNRMWIEYFLLESAKITDPSESRCGRFENFTIANITESINWSVEVSDELDQLQKSVVKFRENISEVRNKLLAHYDKEAFLSGTPLGAFPKGEDDTFIATLERIANVLHTACFGSIIGNICVTGPGDVHDLIKSLKEAAAFKKLFSESKGDELHRLFTYLANEDVHDQACQA